MKEKRFSFGGEILRVDLSSAEIWTEPTVRYASKFLGGRGVDEWILYHEVKPRMSPFDPSNRLIFGTGTLVGTLAPCATRHTIEAKSPVTGGIGSGNSCGFFSPELKFAGYDHIVFQGKSRRPVYLWISDQQVEIRDASHIWGKTTWETDDLIKEEIGDKHFQIACIGPAGENLVNSACIIANRGRAVGRCGLGAIMGSKNLKAVAVRGSGSIEVAHPNRFMEEVDNALEKLRLSARANALRTFGTYARAVGLNEASLSPVRNFQTDFWDPYKVEKTLPDLYKRDYEVRRQGYLACPLYCSHLYRIENGPYAGLVCEGFEFNDVWNFLNRLDINYPPAVIKLHSLCNEYGLDQDSSSCTIAWAFDCYQRGIITENDTDGLKLEWGDHAVAVELLRKMAYREGFGDILAEGSSRGSELVGKGSENYTVCLKGQDSMEPMRAAKGWALGCCVSPRGGAHTRGANLIELSHDSIPTEVAQKLWGISKVEGPLSYEGKAKLVVYYERLQAILDSLGVCMFTSTWWSPDLLGPQEYARLYSAATGHEISGDELMTVAERIHNIEKAFNTLHAGFGRKDDYPPTKFLEEPISSGPLQGERLHADKWGQMLDEYYELHGWDKQTGWQTKCSLENLQLGEIADELKAAGKLID
jgi:aldehyde:ferredoxin oxidoreductase